MHLLRIKQVTPLTGLVLRLTLTDNTKVERDVSALMTGRVFEALRNDRRLFESVRVDDGSVVWPNGADLDPDVLIWGGPPPEDEVRPPKYLKLRLPSRAA